MAPVLRHRRDLHMLCEAFGNNYEDFLFTTFAVIDEDDVVYFGQVDIPKLQITLEQFNSALAPIPDEDIYPQLSSAKDCFTIAPDSMKASDEIYIKRPCLTAYEELKEKDALVIITGTTLDEAHALHLISQHPHPGLIKFHGCRVRRGLITGLVLDKHPSDLYYYLRDNGGPLDKEAFMTALESAVQHLHSIGLAHNDINPRNVLVNSHGLPVLIDFGSCHEIGEDLTFCRGTPGWMDEEDDYATSKICHDTVGLEKIRAWLENPTFEM